MVIKSDDQVPPYARFVNYLQAGHTFLCPPYSVYVPFMGLFYSKYHRSITYGNNKRLDFNLEAEMKVKKSNFTGSATYEAFPSINIVRDSINVGALISFFSL